MNSDNKKPKTHGPTNMSEPKYHVIYVPFNFTESRRRRRRRYPTDLIDLSSLLLPTSSPLPPRPPPNYISQKIFQ